MTMKCPECGKIYMDEDMYCSICGTKLVEKKVGYARMSLFGDTITMKVGIIKDVDVHCLVNKNYS